MFLCEYTRPDPDEVDFDTVFDAPLMDDALREWIMDFGRYNGADGVTVFDFIPKTLSVAGVRCQPEYRLLWSSDIDPVMGGAGSTGCETLPRRR